MKFRQGKKSKKQLDNQRFDFYTDAATNAMIDGIIVENTDATPIRGGWSIYTIPFGYMEDYNRAILS